MELKVTVDNVERFISGLTEDTTCAQIIYALAHATGQKGRFVLVEKYREAERSLAPTDRPLEMLRKWGEHSQFVSFVLKRLDSSSSNTNDSFSFKSNSDTSFQNVFSNTFTPESLISFNPERSSSPITKPLPEEQKWNSLQTSTFKPQNKSEAYKLPKSCSDACFRPDFFGSLKNVTSQHFYSASMMPHIGSLKSRPPPPAYHEVIEKRYNSLTREAPFAIPRSQVWLPNINQKSEAADAKGIIGASNPIVGETNLAKNTTNLSPLELEKLVDDQQAVIERQKAFILQFDASTADDDQRELMQLERQQANLRLVLNPLRARNIPELLKKEKLELENIQKMISDLQQKIEANAKELHEQCLLELKLGEQVAALEQEVSGLEASAVNAEDSLDSPTREMLIS